MLTLPAEVVCGGILPYLSVGDLKALDTAYTNKYLRPQLRQLWRAYQYDTFDIVLKDAEVCWLCGVEVQIISVAIETFPSASESALSNILALKRLCIESFVDNSLLLQLAINSPDLEVLSVKYICGSNIDNTVSALAQNCRQLHILDINSESLTDVGISAVAQYCTQLHTLHIRNTQITDTSIQALCDNCPHLTHIGLSNCRALTDTALNMIASAFPHLQIAHLYFRKFTDDGLIYFADKCHELRSVSIWSDIITSRGLTALWAANPNLMDVDINGFKFVSDDDIVQLVQCCPLLQRLNISRCNNITDAAVIAIAEHCPQLRSLDINFCDEVSDVSLIALGQHCHELKSINISCLKNISDVGIAALAGGCPLLQEFHAVDSNITDAGVIALASGCCDLRKFGLYYNWNIGVAAVSAIAENCPLISELLLSRCNVNDACLYAIARYCHNLTILDISHTKVSSLAAIQLVIRSCRSLREFRCQGCLSDDKNTTNALRKLACRLHVFYV